MSLDKDY